MVLAPFEAACTVPGLRYHFGWALAKGVSEGGRSIGDCRWRAYGASKVCTHPLQEGRGSHPGTSCPGQDGGGMFVEARGDGAYCSQARWRVLVLH